jgi:hypothetical protein
MQLCGKDVTLTRTLEALRRPYYDPLRDVYTIHNRRSRYGIGHSRRRIDKTSAAARELKNIAGNFVLRVRKWDSFFVVE